MPQFFRACSPASSASSQKKYSIVTAQGLTGFASVGSRSAMCAGSAIVHTADVMLVKGKKVASSLLEASEADIQYRSGNFEVVGTDRRISLFETARRAKETGESLDTKEKAET